MEAGWPLLQEIQEILPSMALPSEEQRHATLVGVDSEDAGRVLPGAIRVDVFGLSAYRLRPVGVQ